MAGFLCALWCLVPVHELLHAAGCVLSGGRVAELRVSPWFGGTLLAGVLPWVSASGAAPGRLVGFAPAGDLSYLVTVLLPHLVLAAGGAAVCRTAVRTDSPALFGVGLAGLGQPIAALGGDMYEAAAIPITRAAEVLGAGWATSLRGDDAVAALAQAWSAPGLAPTVVWGVAFAVGALLAVGILRASGGVSPRRLDSGLGRA